MDLTARPFAVAILFAVCACSRSSESANIPSPSSHAPMPMGSMNLEASTTVNPDAKTAAPLAEGSSFDPVLPQVLAWSRALNDHKVAGLDDLYSSEICFYGRLLSKSMVLGSKQGALNANKAFHQEIVGSVKLEYWAPDRSMIATFLKRSGTQGQLHDVRARLVLQNFSRESGCEDAPWLIVSENDDVGPSPGAARELCEAEAQRVLPEADARCEEVAAKAVNDLREVKRAMARVHVEVDARSKHEPNIGVGGFGPQGNGDCSFTVVTGITTAKRLESAVSYTVDRKTGFVDIWIVDDSPPHLSDSAKRAVEAVCKQ